MLPGPGLGLLPSPLGLFPLLLLGLWPPPGLGPWPLLVPHEQDGSGTGMAAAIGESGPGPKEAWAQAAGVGLDAGPSPE